MWPPAKTPKTNEIYGQLGELIQDPRSFGLREPLPRRVLDSLASTRNMLMKYLYDGSMPLEGDNALVAELSQDSDANYCFRDEETIRPFHLLLCRRMELLSLSPHDVAVTLGSTLQHVMDLRSGRQDADRAASRRTCAVAGSDSREPQDSGERASEWRGGDGLIRERLNRAHTPEIQVCRVF